MNLKRIEIYGFKSFADKIELKFDYPITGIVGPNGCGKSNVSDCIRWVLGEQSAKLLRGKTMQDLIFGGTEKRKSMSYCEASLIFDNKQRIFPIEMDEIIISRKLYRNNESEYYLNKNICRLKDISDLLRGVGLGREGYSIVGQGRMDAILNSKPEDRRAIFEEALGISKFRVRKVETERKLDKTKDNMSRLYDILTELDRQLSPLKKQSEDAKKYLDLKEKLKYQEINSYIYSYDNASSNKEKCKDKLKGLAEEYNRKNDEYSTAFEHYDELFNQINDTDKSISLLREEQLQLSIKIERLSGETKLFNERVKHFTTGTAELSQIVADNKSQIQEVNQRIVVIKKQLDDKRVEHANLTERLVSLNEKYVEMTTEIDKYQQQAEVNQGKVVSTLSGLTDHKSRNASLASERITLSNRILVIEQEEAELTAKLKSFS
ncbi:MAG: AAA family ATPase, partial [Clostridia bacterium]